MSTPQPPIILASGSPRRRELLKEAGGRFTAAPPAEDVGCGGCSALGPAGLVAHLADRKAAAVRSTLGKPGRWRSWRPARRRRFARLWGTTVPRWCWTPIRLRSATASFLANRVTRLTHVRCSGGSAGASTGFLLEFACGDWMEVRR